MVLGTQIPAYSQAAWTQRLLQLFPQDWTSDTAKAPGGVLNSMMSALASQLYFLNTGVSYAWASTRIKTATDTTLNLVSEDYFGTTLPRQPGEPDSSFRARILANLFLPAATRPALNQLVTSLTGATPRIMESWNAADTGYWDVLSAWGVDQYVSAPFRWGDPSLRYQGFIETILPPINTALANNFPIWCWDAGYSWDCPNSYWLNPQSTWFLQAGLMDAAIAGIAAEGTIVWRKYSAQSLVSVPVGGSRLLTAASVGFQVGVLPFNGIYIALAQTSWNSVAYISAIGLATFNVSFTTASPSGASFDFIAAPITQVGVGSVPVPVGTFSVAVGVPTGYGSYIPLVTPSWGTNYYVKSVTSSLWTFGLSNGPPTTGSLNYMFFAPNRSGYTAVSAGATQVTIPLIGATSPFEIFVIPDWNTTCSVIFKSTSAITVAFSTPAPSSQILRFGFQNG